MSDKLKANAPKATVTDIGDEKKGITEDSLENLVANMGSEQDKRFHTRFKNSKMLSHGGDHTELDAMYRADWTAGKIVDIIPDDMTREWRTFNGDIDPEQVKALQEEEDRVQLAHQVNLAHKWGRLYGTAFIVMNIDDGNTPDKPLDIDKIKPGGLKHIKAIDRHRVDNSEVVPILDPMSVNFGFPEKYRIRETSVVIHHSRLLRFDGVMLPYDEFRRNNYFSDSVLARVYETMLNFSITAEGASSMVFETNVDIMKVKGLMAYLQTPEQEMLLRKRFTLAGLMKSYNNMLLLDNEEDFQSKTNTFTGLPDLLDRFALHLSAASDIPATRLLGSSASGLNATGEGDLKNYYDTIRSKQKMVYKPMLDYFDQIMVKSLGFSGDADISYKFNSLFQMTPKEQADVQFIDAQRDVLYVDRGIITEATIAKELQQGDVYTNITDEHIEELEEFENVNEFDPDTNNGEIEPKPEDEEGQDEETELDEDSEES